VAKVVELPSKHEALSSNPSTPPKKEKGMLGVGEDNGRLQASLKT
jgi:hypothetical protein